MHTRHIRLYQQIERHTPLTLHKARQLLHIVLKKLKSITTYNMLIFKPYALISAHKTRSPIPANRKAYAINPSQSETTPTHRLKKIKKYNNL